MSRAEGEFVIAAVEWAVRRRPDLLVWRAEWVAAVLCGLDWYAARRHGRGAWKTLVMRDMEEAAMAARSLGRRADVGESVRRSEAMAFHCQSRLSGTPTQRAADVTTKPRHRRRVGRIIRQARKRGWSPKQLLRSPHFVAALGAAVGTCPVIPTRAFVLGASWPTPLADVAGRPSERVFMMTIDFAAFMARFAVRPRRYPAGSSGNDILDRARTLLGEEYEAKVGDLFAHPTDFLCCGAES